MGAAQPDPAGPLQRAAPPPRPRRTGRGRGRTGGAAAVNDLLVVCPTRGRPHNIARLIDAWASTATPELGAQLLVAVDDDDPAKPDYLEVVHEVGFAWLEAGPRPTVPGMTEVLNRYAVRYAGSYQALGFMGDDHQPASDGWDRRVLAALEELGTGIVYGDDRFQRENLPTSAFMTSDIIRALGWMAPPELGHLWVDNAWLN